MAVGRADTNRRCKPLLPSIPGRCNDVGGRKEPTHRRKEGANTHRRRKESASIGGRSQIDEGEEGANTSPPGGGGGVRTWAVCCPPSAFSTPIPLTHGPRFRNSPQQSTPKPEICRRRDPSKTEMTRHPNPSRAATHQPRRKQLVSSVSRGKEDQGEDNDDLERFMMAMRRAQDDPGTTRSFITSTTSFMSAKLNQHRHRPRRITSPDSRIIPPNRHHHITSPHRTDCNTRTTTPGTHQARIAESQSQKPRRNRRIIQDTQFAFAMSEQQSKIENKGAMDTNSKTAGTQKNTKTRQA